MIRGRILTMMAGLGAANAALVAAALALPHPAWYLAVAVAASTLMNLTYAGCLWHVRH